MHTLAAVSQVIIALSIVIVWVFRYNNVVDEFREYRLPNTVRNMVGATKIALSTLLIVGIWIPTLVVIPALLMALLMLGAQLAHVSVRHAWYKSAPSFTLMLLSLFVAGVASGTVR
ncbi:MAG: hypothetical protein NVS4B3_21880 [Gemmatimonadaceae bacterium]